MLRIDVQGFTEFCQDFLSRHGAHFVSPLRLSGSAVESILGQVKYSIGGKLDAASYQVAIGLHFLENKQLNGITVEKIIGMYLYMCMMYRWKERGTGSEKREITYYTCTRNTFLLDFCMYAREVGNINLSATCQPFASIQELQVPVKLFLVARKFFNLHVLVAYVKHACQSTTSKPNINFIWLTFGDANIMLFAASIC